MTLWARSPLMCSFTSWSWFGGMLRQGCATGASSLVGMRCCTASVYPWSRSSWVKPWAYSYWFCKACSWARSSSLPSNAGQSVTLCFHNPLNSEMDYRVLKCLWGLFACVYSVYAIKFSRLVLCGLCAEPILTPEKY